MYSRIFETDPWRLITNTFDRRNMLLLESLSSTGNGYMGMRGNFEEGYSGEHHQGTYIAGVWFPDKTRVGWWKNGYPKYFGKVINAVDFAGIKVEVNGQRIDLAQLEAEDFILELDMRSSLLSRSYTVCAGGARLRLSFRRFLSITERRCAHFQLRLELLSGRADICLYPQLDGDVRNKDSNYDEKFWDISETAERFISMRTKENPFGTPRFTVSAAMRNRLSVPAQIRQSVAESRVTESFSFALGCGESAVLEKTAAVITDRDTPAWEHKALAMSLLEKAADFDTELSAQSAAWAERWERADVTVEGDDEAQQGIRFNLFQLFSTYYGEDERLNIGPKGFTGEKYGGATYWDTEAFILPMYLSAAAPEVNRKLLKYRFDQLEGAKHNAREQGLDGALYPMVTFTGVECHNEWEITFEEIHRNGAVAYAIYNYTNYTGDRSYLEEYGLDVLVGISRFWASRVHYSARQKKYMLHGVTGPNEYENNVNNNWYTNMLCRWTLEYTLENLTARKEAELNVTAEEKMRWADIRDNTYLGEDRELGIFIQNDCFLDKDLRSVDTLGSGDRPLNQHWSWDRILRSCFIKQADVLQGIYMFGDRFTREQKEKNFDFYEPMTVHESSLSASIHSVIASELGKREKAMELYLRTARLDLDNYNNDTADGLHITSMSGGWLAIVQGFAGMRSFGGELSFAPYCPDKWSGYSFNVLYRGRLIRVGTDRERVTVTLISGERLKIRLYGREYTLADSVTVRSVQGIIFDLDGVVCSTDEYHYQAWKSLADELGIYFDRKINERLRGVSRMDSLEIILERSKKQYTQEEKERLAAVKNERYVKLLQQLSPDSVLPGIKDFLAACRENGIKTALASASKNAPFIISRLGLENEFDYIADAAKVKRSKPAPDIFLAAAEGIGSSPEHCIGIEDARAGIEAIHAAGMKAVGIGTEKNLGAAELLLADTSRLSLTDVLKLN